MSFIYFVRFLSLFLCIFFVVFSVTVSAYDVDDFLSAMDDISSGSVSDFPITAAPGSELPDPDVDFEDPGFISPFSLNPSDFQSSDNFLQFGLLYGRSSSSHSSLSQYYPSSSSSFSSTVSSSSFDYRSNTNPYTSAFISIGSNGSSGVVLRSGYSGHFEISGLIISRYRSSGYDYPSFDNLSFSLSLSSKDGECSVFSGSDLSVSSSSSSFSSRTVLDLSFDIPSVNFDVSNITLSFPVSFSPYSDIDNNYLYLFNVGFFNSSFTCSQSDQSPSGLLSSLIQWVKGIFETVSNGFSNILSTLRNLPQSIWSVFSDGLKSLFVPSDSFFDGLSDNWSSLLSSRFGFLYDVTDDIVDIFNSLVSSNDVQTVIDFPSVTIPILDSSFSFGGWSVDVVPSGFDFLHSFVRSGVTLVLFVFFLNAMRRRFDNIMGDNDDN